MPTVEGLLEHGFAIEVVSAGRFATNEEKEPALHILKRNYEIYKGIYERDNPGAVLGEFVIIENQIATPAEDGNGFISKFAWYATSEPV